MFREMAGLDRVHFVGIGGAGMSGIAEVLLDFELEVSGSDLVESANTRRLEERGARIVIGHAAEHVVGADVVVKSSAVPEDNPEIEEARRRGIAVVRRSEMLAELMRLKYGIAVAGTHGKTTTTSLVGTLLTEAGLDPTVIVGGRLRVSGTGARYGASRYLVVEADEYDRSFLRLAPILAVITSIDAEHLDTYGDMEALEAAFLEFASAVPFFGRVIVCLDDPNIQRLLERLSDRRVMSYGFSPQATLVARDYRPTEDGCRFAVRDAEEGLLGELGLPLPGEHNARNALAAIAVALALGLDFDAIVDGLSAFQGVHRRFERLGEFRGAAVIDDYAHHPAEVEATLGAARQTFPEATIHAVFQPHLYSRTELLASDFGRALLGADTALVTAVFGSRESPRPGVTGELVAEAARASGHRDVDFEPQRDRVRALLEERVKPGDVVLTLGAGDVHEIAESLVEEPVAEEAGA